jgi:ribosomal protein S20
LIGATVCFPVHAQGLLRFPRSLIGITQKALRVASQKSHARTAVQNFKKNTDNVIEDKPDDYSEKLRQVKLGSCVTENPSILFRGLIEKKNSSRKSADKALMRSYDQAWKIVVGENLQAALDVLWPELSGEIDWAQQSTTLDKELETIRPHSGLKKQIVDKLFEVKILGGQETSILLHVEFQAQKDATIADRMMQYLCALRLRYPGRRIEQMLVLLDKDQRFQPNTYNYSRENICTLHYQFKTVKVSDWKGILTFENVHKAPKNIFNFIILMQLESMFTGPKDQRSTFNKIKAFLAEVGRSGHTDAEKRHALVFCEYVLRLSDPALMDEVQQEVERQKKISSEPVDYLGVFSYRAYHDGNLEGRIAVAAAMIQDGVSEEKALRIAGVSPVDFEKR